MIFSHFVNQLDRIFLQHISSIDMLQMNHHYQQTLQQQQQQQRQQVHSAVSATNWDPTEHFGSLKVVALIIIIIVIVHATCILY